MGVQRATNASRWGQSGSASTPVGDGGTAGIDRGTFDNLAAVRVAFPTANGGDWSVLRSGGVAIYSVVTSTWEIASSSIPAPDPS